MLKETYAHAYTYNNANIHTYIHTYICLYVYIGAATGTTQTSQTLLSGDAPNNNAFDHMTFASATRRPSNSGRGSSSITVGIQQTGGRKSSGGSGTSRRKS